MVFTELIANFIELLTLIGGILSVLLIIILIYNKFTRKKSFKTTLNYVGENYLLFGFIVSLVATLGSLFYSEVMGFNPCILCWYQRILMYPQVLLFGVAMWKKDFGVKKYSLALSIIGVLLAGYHYLGQIGVLTLSGCDAIGYSASCSEFFFLSFGYITIPMMALTAFVMLVLLGIAGKK